MIEPNRKPPKKSDVLEVRLPHRTKQAFMQKARAEGRAASEIIRDYIDLYLAVGDAPSTSLRERTMTLVRKNAKALAATVTGATAAIAIGMAVMPANAVPDLRAAFAVLDRNGDGVVTLDEFDPPGDVRIRVDAPELPAGSQGGLVMTLPHEPSGDRIFLRHAAPFGADHGAPFVMQLHLPASPGAETDLATVIPDQFEAMDADGDGKLSYDEFETRHRTMMADAFKALDRDGNGSVSVEELAIATSGAAAALGHLDGDGDGSVTLDEFTSPKG